MPQSVRGDKSLARLEQETSLHTSLVYSHKLPSMHTLNTVIAGCPGSVSKQASMTDFQHNTSISSVVACLAVAGVHLQHKQARTYARSCMQQHNTVMSAGNASCRLGKLAGATAASASSAYPVLPHSSPNSCTFLRQSCCVIRSIGCRRSGGYPVSLHLPYSHAPNPEITKNYTPRSLLEGCGKIVVEGGSIDII